MSLVKSKQRVADHGEVFTPVWMVEAMLDLVKDETERIDSRFLEPACALTMRAVRDIGDQPIQFAEGGYLGKGKYQKRDFRFDVLTGSSAFSAEGSLFADLGKHEIFAPIKTHAPMTVRELTTKSSRL